MCECMLLLKLLRRLFQKPLHISSRTDSRHVESASKLAIRCVSFPYLQYQLFTNMGNNAVICLFNANLVIGSRNFIIIIKLMLRGCVQGVLIFNVGNFMHCFENLDFKLSISFFLQSVTRFNTIMQAKYIKFNRYPSIYCVLYIKTVSNN